MTPVLWMLALPGCDDTTFPQGNGGGGGAPIGDAEGWCAAQALFAGSCTSCHSSASALGGLDLETDPHAALVGVTSASYGVPLVTPGDPDASLLLRKISGTQAADEGSQMPPGGQVDPAVIEKVRTWIADGAPESCDDTGGPVVPPADGVHPDGWGPSTSGGERGVHGRTAKLDAGVIELGTCTDAGCHGAELEGDAGPACGSCHDPIIGRDWRTSCTFCHGDRDGDPADPFAQAPPQDIDDNDDPAEISFPGHRLHIESPLHADWDCTQCHLKPTSALQEGHLFTDDSPGVADLAFGAGLSPDGSYDYAAQSCANLYCHGNGQGDNGTVSVAGGPRNCDSCHQGPNSDGAQMSGQHERHLDEGRECFECHDQTINTQDEITGNGRLHVDGKADVNFYSDTNMQITAELRCTGSCHGEQHNGRSWLGGD